MEIIAMLVWDGYHGIDGPGELLSSILMYHTPTLSRWIIAFLPPKKQAEKTNNPKGWGGRILLLYTTINFPTGMRMDLPLYNGKSSLTPKQEYRFPLIVAKHSHPCGQEREAHWWEWQIHSHPSRQEGKKGSGGINHFLLSLWSLIKLTSAAQGPESRTTGPKGCIKPILVYYSQFY